MDVIESWLREHRISEVEVLVPDLTGNARGKFIPAGQYLQRGYPKLPESILVQTVTGEFSDDHWDFVAPTDSDMMLKPDPSTMRVVPWARESTAQIVHDCYTSEDELHPLATRSSGGHSLDGPACDTRGQLRRRTAMAGEMGHPGQQRILRLLVRLQSAIEQTFAQRAGGKGHFLNR